MAQFSSTDDIIISYCIPVLNRADDLIETLDHNLSANLNFMGSIEFLIIIFDKDDFLYDRIVEKYSEYIESSYLRVVKSKALMRWHFGRAKNAFKPYVRGRLYSSLDADNFVTAAETEQILELYKIHKGRCIIHHFQGVWGDGTCGRVTAPTDIYKTVGYDDSLMPRQFDELDFIISILSNNPNMPYITYFPGGFVSTSNAARSFLQDERLAINNIVVPRPLGIPPLNPTFDDCAHRDALRDAMGGFNKSLSFAKNSNSSERKEKYLNRVTEYGYRLIDQMSPDDLLSVFFDTESPQPIERHNSSDDIPVFCVLKDDETFLRDWYQHYVSLGCGPFFLVDDGSAKPITETINASDVFVFRPVCGNYRACKSVWIAALMKIYLKTDDWVLTVDADEFLDVPNYFGGKLSNVIELAEEKEQRLVPGLLVDMVPREASTASQALASGEPFLKIFSHHCWDEDEPDIAYEAMTAVKWAFGAYWRTSSRIDVRYRLFGTIDVLRKIPLLRYSATVVLSEGWHDVRDAQTGSGVRAAKLWSDGRALPIRHYKLVNLFSGEGRTRICHKGKSQVWDVYDKKTAESLRRITEVDIEELRTKMSSIPIVPYLPDRVSECRRQGPIERFQQALRYVRFQARKGN